MSQAEVNAVLAQMRAMAVQAKGVPQKPAGGDVASDFATLLKQSINSVNETQQEAGRLSEAFARGETQDLAQVMIAAQKSSVSFQAMVQVRNKLVQAYQDVMNMPI